MEYCNKCDIVFDDKDCPLCVAKDAIKDLEKRVESLEEQLQHMEE